MSAPSAGDGDGERFPANVSSGSLLRGARLPSVTELDYACLPRLARGTRIVGASRAISVRDGNRRGRSRLSGLGCRGGFGKFGGGLALVRDGFEEVDADD